METSRLLGGAMVRQYRKLDEDFKSGAVRLVFETGKPIAQVARDLGVNEGTLGNWVAAARRQADRAGGPGPGGQRGHAGPRVRQFVGSRGLRIRVLSGGDAYWRVFRACHYTLRWPE